MMNKKPFLLFRPVSDKVALTIISVWVLILLLIGLMLVLSINVGVPIQTGLLDLLQVSVLERGRIFQPVAHQPIGADMRDPDQG